MPVCITGMHRSGTSMVTKLLKESGLYLGPDDDLMPPATENPEGFWENLHIVELNEEILNALGGGWDCPPPIPEDWSTARLAPLRTKAQTIVAHFAGREPWGWKDPRSSLTVPFWRGILGPTKVVIVIRNPLEVALSLRLRNGFSFALGLTLWQIYSRRCLDDAAPADRIVTHFDAYFTDPETELRRLLTFLELPFAEDVIEVFRVGNAADLRHHRVTTSELIDAEVSSEVFDLYRALCDEADWRDTDAARPQPGIALPAADAPPSPPSPLEIGVGRLNRSAMDVRVLQRELEEHQRSLAGREARVHDLELTVRAQEMALTRLAELERQVKEHEAVEREVSMLRQTVGDQADHLDLFAVQLSGMLTHEQELRGMLVDAHQQLFLRDAEVIATLGAALARHAPGAPAAIYYRTLLQTVRDLVAANLPPGEPVAVASWGDDAMLELDDRDAWHFPLTDVRPGTDYTSIDGSVAISQLELLRSRGAGYLVVPASAQSWLARYPDVEDYLERRYPAAVREDGICVIYALGVAPARERPEGTAQRAPGGEPNSPAPADGSGAEESPSPAVGGGVGERAGRTDAREGSERT